MNRMLIAAPINCFTYGELKDRAAVYSGTIDNTDRAISRVVEKLNQMGVREDTLIIYASDTLVATGTIVSAI